MSDNVPYQADPTVIWAADDIGGIKFQRCKFVLGPDGSATEVTPPDTDSKAATTILPAAPMLSNGTTFDPQRGNIEGTAPGLASAPRTATTSSTDLKNVNGCGLHAILNVSAAGGALSLVLTIEGKDPVSGSYYALNANPTAITGTGLTVYSIYPGVGVASGGVTQRTSGTVPRTFRITVTHGNATSATYSVGYSLLV